MFTLKRKHSSGRIYSERKKTQNFWNLLLQISDYFIALKSFLFCFAYISQVIIKTFFSRHFTTNAKPHSILHTINWKSY